MEEIAGLADEHEARLLVVDAALTPVQQKTLEEDTGCKVIDRTGLILEIFGERAATAEGRQVELAHLDYQAGRLVRAGPTLSGSAAASASSAGPAKPRSRPTAGRSATGWLGSVAARPGAAHARAARPAPTRPWPVIALVGYTNAGKSTLFNRMTQAAVVAEDLLFATLDPTMRNVKIPGFDRAILSDTVGFVSNLPTELVAAFRATLEEVAASDLILHVRDIAHPDSAGCRRRGGVVIAGPGRRGFSSEAGSVEQA